MGLVVLVEGPAAVASSSRVIKRAEVDTAVEYCAAAAALADSARQQARLQQQALQAAQAKGWLRGMAAANAEMAERLTTAAAHEHTGLERLRTAMIQIVGDAVAQTLNQVDRRIWFESVLRAVDDQFGQCKRLSLTVHPTSVERLREALDAPATRSFRGTIEIREKKALPLDACEIESEAGFARTSIDAQVAVIRKALQQSFDAPAAQQDST